MTGNHYEFLGVGWDAASIVIWDAASRKRRELEAAGGGRNEFAALDEAIRTLTSPTDRAEYDASLGDGPQGVPDARTPETARGPRSPTR